MTSREKRLLGVVVLGLILVLGYYFVYRPITVRSEELNEEIATIENELIQIRAQYDNQDVYIKEIEENQLFINDVQKDYPADIEQNRAFKLLFDIEETFPELKFDSIAFGNKELLTSSNDQGDNSTISAYRRNIISDTEMTYSDLKKFLEYVYEYKDRTVLSSLNMVLNEESGLVNVSVTLNQYALLGAERETEDIIFDDVDYGRELLFDSPNIDWNTLGGEPVSYATDSQEDLFIALSPEYSDGYTHVIGKVIDSGQRSYVQKESNTSLNGSLRIFNEGDIFYATYDIDGTVADRQSFEIGTALELVVYSSSRGENDNVTLNLNVYNQTGLTLLVDVKSDDIDRPRFNMSVNQGDVILK